MPIAAAMGCRYITELTAQSSVYRSGTSSRTGSLTAESDNSESPAETDNSDRLLLYFRARADAAVLHGENRRLVHVEYKTLVTMGLKTAGSYSIRLHRLEVCTTGSFRKL